MIDHGNKILDVENFIPIQISRGSSTTTFNAEITAFIHQLLEKIFGITTTPTTNSTIAAIT